jgi:hypothetical protein
MRICVSRERERAWEFVVSRREVKERGTNLLGVALLLLLLAVLLLRRITVAAASGGAGVVVLGGHGGWL